MRDNLAIAFEGLLRSRKFWLLVMDALISSIVYFGGKYLAPQAMDDLKFIIAGWQPIVLLVIGAIAAEDIAQKYLAVHLQSNRKAK